MCEEKLDLIQDFVTTLQRQSIELSRTGFTVTYQGEEYGFVPTFRDRWCLKNLQI